jgi:hypothetical protein
MEAINMAEKTEQPSRGIMRDFGHYVKWWLVWGFVLAGVNLLSNLGDFSSVKWMDFAWGCAVTSAWMFASALAFTWLQNLFNKSRYKSVSWVAAIAAFLGDFSFFLSFRDRARVRIHG